MVPGDTRVIPKNNLLRALRSSSNYIVARMGMKSKGLGRGVGLIFRNKCGIIESKKRATW